jgi:hypothetical protein
MTKAERAVLNAAIAWFEGDHKPLEPGEDNPADGPLHDKLMANIGDLINERAYKLATKPTRKKNHP